MPKKLFWIYIGIAILIVVLGLLAIRYQNRRHLQSVLSRMPQEFILAGGDGRAFSVFQPETNSDFQLRTSEELSGEGIVYTINKEPEDAERDVFQMVTSKGWMFIGGAKRVADGIIFKVTDGRRYFFIKVSAADSVGSPQADGASSVISIVEVNQK